MVLEEFDKTKSAVINPENLVNHIDDFPTIGVTCFSNTLFFQIVNQYNGRLITNLERSDGTTPIYKIKYKDKSLALFLSKVGAPACIAFLEDLFVMGLEKIVIFGTCGVLKSTIDDLSIIIPNSAIRDEGTSYHYAKGNREININSKHINSFIKLLEKKEIKYSVGKVWTTDAPYRETKKKVKKRKEEGCICVDMECSAIAALAHFRKKDIFQFFYAADNLDAKEWNIRSLRDNDKLTIKKEIGNLAVEMASII